MRSHPRSTPPARARAPRGEDRPGAKQRAAKNNAHTGSPPAASPVAKRSVAKTAARKSPREAQVRLLAGGNPQIAKADGDAPVQAYIAAIPGWKQNVVRRLDALVVHAVPGVRKAVKWNSPLYGVEGRGWFMSLHVFARAVKVTFFKGTSLRSPPAGGSAKEARWIDIHEDDLDEATIVSWIEEAAALPGWMA